MDEYDEHLGGSDTEDLSDRIDELEQRLQELSEAHADHDGIGGAVAYIIGTSLAITLSWSRNASILWCILHGALSWLYVVYFAVTR